METFKKLLPQPMQASLEAVDNIASSVLGNPTTNNQSDDLVTNKQTLQPGQMSTYGAGTVVSNTQKPTPAISLGQTTVQKFPTCLDVPTTIQEQAGRFFYVQTEIWKPDHGVGDTVVDLNFPDVLINNPKFCVNGLTKYHNFARFGIEVMLQINATQFQQGCLAACMVPGDSAMISYASMLVGSSGLLNCSKNNELILKVPYVYTKGMFKLRNPSYPMYNLNVRVWSVVKSAAETTNEVFITVWARLVDLELHGMAPLQGLGVQTVNIAPGQGVVNFSNAQDAQAIHSLALGQEILIGDDTIAGGERVENLKDYVRIPGLVKTFTLSTDHAVGHLASWFTVNPFSDLTYSDDGYQMTPMSMASLGYNFWRGDITYTFQVVATPYHSCRLMFAFVVEDSSTVGHNRDLDDASMAYVSTFDLTGDNTSVSVTVPWMSDTYYKNIKKTDNKETLSHKVGTMYVFVVNRLRCPANVSKTIEVLVLHHSNNLELFCPTWDGIYKPTIAFQGDENVPEKAHSPAEVKTTDVTSVEISRGVCDKTFKQIEEKPKQHTADHMDLRTLFGRAHHLTSFHTNNESLSDILIPINFDYNNFNRFNGQVLNWMCNIVHMFRGPLDLIFVVRNEPIAQLGKYYITFLPGQSSVQQHYISNFVSSGAVLWDLNLASSVKVRVPWYTHLDTMTQHCGMKEGKAEKIRESQLHSWIRMVQIGNFSADIDVYVSMPQEFAFYNFRPCINSKYLIIDREVMQVGKTLLNQAVNPGTMVDVVNNQVYHLKTSVEQYLIQDSIENHQSFTLSSLEFQNKTKIKNRGGFFFIDKSDILKPGDIITGVNGIDIRSYTVEQFVKLVESGPVHTVTTSSVDCVRFESSASIVSLDGHQYGIKTVGGIFVYHRDEGCVRQVTCEYETVVREIMFDHALEELLLSIRLDPKELNIQETVQEMKLPAVQTRSLIGMLMYLTDHVITQDVTQEATDQVTSALGKLTKFIKNKRLDRTTRVVVKILTKIAKLTGTMYLYQYVKTATGALALIAQWLDEISVTVDLFLEMFVDLCQGKFDARKVLYVFLDSVSIEHTKLPEMQSEGIYKKLSQFNTCMGAIKNFEWFFKKIWESIGSVLDKWSDMPDVYEEINDWMCLVETLLSQPQKCVTRLHDTIQRGWDLRTKAPEKYKSQINQRLRDLYIACSTTREDNVCVVNRPEPVVVYMYGQRGSGKSLASVALAAQICKRMGWKYEESVYSKPPGDYWDAYIGQPIVMIDDMGQNSDGKDWTDFCQIVSSTPQRLNMADLSEKGRLFTSKIIICTSNFPDPAPPTICISDALRRRIAFRFEVKPKEDYAKTQEGCTFKVLDVDKAKRDQCLKGLTCCKFISKGVSNSLGISLREDDEWTLEEILDYMIQKVDKNQDIIDDLIAANMQALLCCSCGSADIQYDIKEMIDEKDLMLRRVISILELIFWSVSIAGGIYCLINARKKNQRDAVIDKMIREATDKEIYQGPYSGHVIKEQLKANPKPSFVELPVKSESTNLTDIFTKNQIVYTANGVSCNGFMVGGSTLLTNKHSWPKDGKITIGDKVYETKVYQSNSGDVLLAEINGFREYKSMSKHFITVSELDGLQMESCLLLTRKNGKEVRVLESEVKVQKHGVFQHNDEVIKVPIYAVGEAYTEAGYCGGILITTESQPRIIGIHTAGTGFKAYTSVVPLEQLYMLAKPNRMMKVELQQDTISIQRKTKYKKGIEFEVDREPAILSDNDVRSVGLDPWVVGLSKYSTPVIDVRKNYENISDLLLGYFRNVDRRPLTMHEAVEGIDGLESVDFKTSSGLPWSLKNMKKKEIWNQGDPIPEFVDAVKYQLSAMTNGDPCEVVFATYLKDELRKKSKILKNATRLIEAAPFHHVVAFRMIAGRFMAHMVKNNGTKVFSAVGCDPDVDWHRFLTEFKMKCYKIVDLDFSDWDGTMQPWMLREALRVISPEHQTSLAKTYEVTTRQYANIQYTISGSLPSGMPATSLVNSLINTLNTIYVFREMGFSFQQFLDHVCLLTYGDDIVMGVSEELYKEINLDHLLLGYKSLGLKPTAGDKSDKLSWKDVDDFYFLKRRSRVDECGVHRPLIDKDVCYQMLRYKTKNATLKDNVRTASWFMHHYGKEDYFQFMTEVVKRSKKLAEKMPVFEDMNWTFYHKLGMC
ncbi:polyprotein [rohelivirus A1]|uniref:Genome polyprotein n=1 Tax=rohelivirus A1 TaxID=2847266 RepID=A0A1I9WAL8_9PICO|nr:polyprotein [rohelivirus A1]APA29017.1 polyprotein [rohelivirus A1]